MEKSSQEPGKDKPLPPPGNGATDSGKKAPKTDQQKLFGVLMLEAGVEFAFLIAGPLVGGLFLGKWLDGKYNANFYVIIGILAGLAISCVAIYKRVLGYKKILDKKQVK